MKEKWRRRERETLITSIDCFNSRTLEPPRNVDGGSDNRAGPSGGTSKKHTRSRGRSKKAADPYASTYGIVPLKMFRGRPWTSTRDLGEATVGKHVLLFGKVFAVRPLGSTKAVVVLFNSLTSCTVRCVVVAGAHEGVTTRTVRFAATLTRETAIDVEGVSGKILATTQQVEIQVTKLHTIEHGSSTKPQDAKFERSRASITPRPVKLEESVVE
ncbi:aspartate--tRNA ligase 2, cytoplasmic-like [Panicum miliaceum]|uniref:Aspartate--tRNA ligase 2, cytoplasmic-like n=1 Tax=Panicum miliaceum TaxID=4540 RepID=A0A3L6PNA3_PANMI|nr:aspartate--tRNA ligase 2, cytoplasmic-like [Panicum miliaceum]